VSVRPAAPKAIAEITEVWEDSGKNTAIVSTLLTDRQGGAVRITDFAPRYRQFGRVFRHLSMVLVSDRRGRIQVAAPYRAELNIGMAGQPGCVHSVCPYSGSDQSHFQLISHEVSIHR